MIPNDFTERTPSDEKSFVNLVWADEFEGTALKTENWQHVSDAAEFTNLPWQMYVDYVRLYQ